MVYILIIVGSILTLLMCWQESKRRKISFIGALAFCLFISPLFGYFVIVGMFPLRNVAGCAWCGNKYNEAEYCGICMKNKDGMTKEVVESGNRG